MHFVYLYVFVLYLYEKKLELISVITFIITLLTHPVHLNPPLTQPYYHNLSITLPTIPPQYQQMCFAIQYELNKYLVHIFIMYIAVKATKVCNDSELCSNVVLVMC